jgi:hypothetical protein
MPSSDPWQSLAYERDIREHYAVPESAEDEPAYYPDEPGTDELYQMDRSAGPWESERDELFGHPSIRGSHIDYDLQFASAHAPGEQDVR